MEIAALTANLISISEGVYATFDTFYNNELSNSKFIELTEKSNKS